MDTPMHEGQNSPSGRLAHELARHLASRTAAALTMAGQAYKLEVRPDEAYSELIRILRHWVEQHVDLPETERGK